jgi:hypothetical protein
MFTVSSTGGDEPYSAVRFRESTGDSAVRREREKESSIRRTELNKALWLIIASKLLSALPSPSSHAHSSEKERDREGDGKGVRSDHARSMLALLEGEEDSAKALHSSLRCTLLYCTVLCCRILSYYLYSSSPHLSSIFLLASVPILFLSPLLIFSLRPLLSPPLPLVLRLSSSLSHTFYLLIVMTTCGIRETKTPLLCFALSIYIQRI